MDPKEPDHEYNSMVCEIEREQEETMGAQETKEDKVIEPGRCGNCRWFGGHIERGVGYCFFSPPTRGSHGGALPQVHKNGGCSQYSAATMPGSGYQYAPLGGK